MNDNRDTINLIKDSIDIVSLIERSVRLKKAGKNFLGLCPFHNEKTPSFIVSPDIQRYKCFGCGKSGDIFNFVQETENIDFVETLKKLAEEAGVKLEQKKGSEKFSDLIEVNETAMKIFESQLDQNKDVQKYLEERGLSKESIKHFNIGFSGSYNSLLKSIRSKKQYSKTQLLNSGLFTEKEGSVKDRFIKRVMFPIKSVSGRVIAYTGRQMPGDDFGPKYLNTPETPVFHKRETLFGIYESKNEIRKERYALLCEGSTDVISAHSIGIRNIVAPLGTGLTDQQVLLLKRYTENLHFIFDADQAGEKAVERGFKIAAKYGMNTYAGSTTPYKDIDELIQSDPEKAKKVCRPKVDSFTFLLNLQLNKRDITKMKDYNYIFNYAKELLSHVTNPVHKKFYIEKLRSIAKIDLNEPASQKSDASTDTNLTKDRHRYLWSNKENYFLALVLRDNYVKNLEKVDEKFFFDPLTKEVLIYLKNNPESKNQDLIDQTDISHEAKALLEAIFFNLDSLPNSGLDTKDELNEVYERIKAEFKNKLLQRLRVQLATAEESENEEVIKKTTAKIKDLMKEIKKR